MVEITIQIPDELCTDEVKQFAEEAKQCTELYSKKNHDYGNSFDKGMDNIGMTYGVGRIYDKTNRLVTITKDCNEHTIQINTETIDDTLRDLACYAIMMLTYRKRQINKEQQKINFE